MSESVSEFKCDKLDKQYMLRIPEVLDCYLKSLTPTQKKRLNEEIIRLMARACHENRFDYSIYTCAD